ncbi:hypothetical protein WA026_002091 [Henosepilachna vigintioctopunctata]|uniref:Uncharacterized protein n=1 Tax=Henosepilachna vigintioctopunctata TaxID=420089 RepID=A0AAW1TYH6_9CUCU
MSSKNIYENLPLKTLNKKDTKQAENEPLVSQKIKTVQNIFNPLDFKPKKRKSNPDIYNRIPSNVSRKPKSSKSISEMFFNKNTNGLNETLGNLKIGTNSTKSKESLCKNSGDKQDNENVKTAKVQSNSRDKSVLQSTPTSSVLDDGYESCNSTPLVSAPGRVDSGPSPAILVPRNAVICRGPTVGIRPFIMGTHRQHLAVVLRIQHPISPIPECAIMRYTTDDEIWAFGYAGKFDGKLVH